MKNDINNPTLYVQFAEMAPGADLIDNGPGGSTVVIGTQPPVVSGIVEDFGAVSSLSITQCSYGSVGSCDIETTVTDQPLTNFVKASRGQLIGVDIWVTGDTSTVATPGSVQKIKVFSGFVDEPEYAFHKDNLKIPCRDRSSLLIESDVQARQYNSKSVHDVVVSLANSAGLDTQTNNGLPSLIANDAKTQLATGMLLTNPNSRSLSSKRSSAWEFIQKMAEAIGYVAFATPVGQLYFGPRVRADLSAVTLTFGGAGTSQAQGDFEIGPLVTHAPMRCGAFHVQVASHDARSGSTHQHTATYINPDKLALFGSNLQPLSTGLTYAQVREQVGDVQIYNFFADGLQPDACQNKAISHALDIMAHEFVLKGTIEGNHGIQVGQAMKVAGISGANQNPQIYVLTGITQEFIIPQARGEANGFQTHLVAWNTLQGK